MKAVNLFLLLGGGTFGKKRIFKEITYLHKCTGDFLLLSQHNFSS